MIETFFDRTVAVQIARPLDYFKPRPNAIVVRALRVTFSIERHNGSEPNRCDISIYNLAESTRAELQHKPLQVRLDAGYDGKPKHLFTGDLRHAWSERDGVDWVTHMQLGDGDRAYGHAHVSRTFAAGAHAGDIVQDAAAAMNLAIDGVETLTKLKNYVYAHGVSVHGPARKALTDALKRAGKTWSVQNGRLQILGPGEARSDEAAVISQGTGMLGSPSFGTPDKSGKPPTLTVKTLLYPELYPGRRVKVESRAINGIFKIERATDAGDTHGEEWSTTIECKPL